MAVSFRKLRTLDVKAFGMISLKLLYYIHLIELLTKWLVRTMVDCAFLLTKLPLSALKP